jgi:hypothetical protein
MVLSFNSVALFVAGNREESPVKISRGEIIHGVRLFWTTNLVLLDAEIGRKSI